MAKYDITYACGHTGTVELYGKETGRERRIEWLENYGDCPACYKAKMRAKQAQEPITMQITTNGMDKDTNGDIVAEIALLGGTINRKDEIKGMGYHWHELRGGAMDLLSMNRPQQAWCKTIAIIKIGQSPEWDVIAREAESLGAEIKIKIDPISLELAARNTDQKRQADEQIAKLDKPNRPSCHPRSLHPKGQWNGTYYGRPGNRNYYIDGINYTLTDTEYDVCMVFRSAMRDYNAACEKIRKGETK